MQDETQNEIIDLDFSMDDPTLQLDRPVLKEGVYDIQCVATKSAVTGKGAKMLKVQFKTINPAETTSGKPVSPGLPVWDQMMLEDVGKMTPGSWRDKVGKVHRAITGDTSGRPSTGAWQGKTVKVKIVVTPERTDDNTGKTYPEGNEISFYYPPTTA